MGSITPMLMAGVTTGMAYDSYNKTEQHRNRMAAQKKHRLQREKHRNIASNRARQYASGIGGRSAENIRDDMRNRYDHAIGNVAGAGDNTMGRINLLAKSVRDWEQLS